MSGGAAAAQLGVRFAVGATVAVVLTALASLGGVDVVARWAPLLLGLASAAALVGVVCGMVARRREAGRGGSDGEVARAARLAVRLGVATALSPVLIGVGFVAYLVLTRRGQP